MTDNATPKPLSEKRIEQLRELYRPGSHYRSGDIEGLLAYIDALKTQPAPVPLAEDEALIAEIRARCHAATAAPWVADISPDGSLADVNHATLVDELGEPQTVALCDIVGNNENDACFIAHSREDIPALLERLSLRSGQLARVLALLDGGKWPDGAATFTDALRLAIEGAK